MQGDEKEHEWIRERIMSSGAPAMLARVLGSLGVESEEVGGWLGGGDAWP